MKFLKAVIIVFMILSMFNTSSIKALDNSELSESKKVLFISSYNAGFDTLPSQVAGLQSVFANSHVVLDIDYMDTKQNDFEDNYNNYYTFLKSRLDHGLKYDLVIVGDDNGLQFLMDYRESLFPDTPIIFFCINDLTRARLADEMPFITGIVEGISVDENLKLARDLFPKAKKIIGIVDKTATGLGDADSFLEAADRLNIKGAELLNVSEYSFETFEAELSKISEDNIVFHLSMFEDKNGQRMTIPEATNMIAEHVKAPVFRMSIYGVGQGVLGGHMVSYEEQGKLAALMAIEVLNGKDIDSIQMIEDSPNKYFFDYHMMEKFGLSMADIPKDSIIINEPINFFDENKQILIPGFLVISVLMLFIIILVRDNRKLKEKDKQLIEKNEELTALYEEITVSEEEIRSQYDLLMESNKLLDESEERYRHLAYTDLLTGLSNRNAFHEFLDEFVNQKKSWYLLYIDLDDFKYINDSRGHEVGDEVLLQLSQRLLMFSEDTYYIGRLGGDEFVMILDKTHDLDSFIKKLQEEVFKNIQIEEVEFSLSCSIGAVEFPKDGTNRNILMRKADMAMYYGKNLGKGQYANFAVEMEKAMTDKLLIRNRLLYAIEYNEFELFYQPQVDLNNNAQMKAECLIRWKDGNGQYISPGMFIPIAESEGLIRHIGRWVYENAAKNARAWQEQYNKPLFYSVNASAEEIMDQQFARKFIEILDKYKIDHETVALEITETVFIESKDKAIQQLQQLRDHNIKIHLDDFGSGYSSLNYLVQLPIDVIKIDRQFIKDITKDPRIKELTNSIIDISHKLELEVIAEGVETLEQYQVLEGMNCDKIQGFYYAKPMPYHQLEVFSSSYLSEKEEK